MQTLSAVRPRTQTAPLPTTTPVKLTPWSLLAMQATQIVTALAMARPWLPPWPQVVAHNLGIRVALGGYRGYRHHYRFQLL